MFSSVLTEHRSTERRRQALAWVPRPRELPTWQAALALGLAGLLRAQEKETSRRLIQLCSADPRTRQTVAAAACALEGLPLMAVDVAALPEDLFGLPAPPPSRGLGRDGVVLLESEDAVGLGRALWLAARTSGPVLLSGWEVPVEDASVLRVEVSPAAWTSEFRLPARRAA